MEMPKSGQFSGNSDVLTVDRKRFQRVVNPSLPAVILDEEGSVRHITPAASRLLEYRSDQHPTGTFFSHVHGRNQYQVMRDIADMVCYGKTGATWLLRLKTGSGRWEWFKATVRNHLSEGYIAISLRAVTE